MTPVLKVEGPVECTIIRRRNRFVVEVEADGQQTTASINNTERLTGFLAPGQRAYCLPHAGLKTLFQLFAVEAHGAGALIDTRLQMRAFEASVQHGLIPWLAGYRLIRRDARLRTSVIDYVLDGPGEQVYLEVKSALMKNGEYAMYPDCPSIRGQRHVRHLTEYAGTGHHAFIVFLAALPGVGAFRPHRAADPLLYDLLVTAYRAGVILKAVSLFFDPEASVVRLVNADLPVELH